MDSYIGQIMLFGFDYAPYGWAICDGRLMSINDHEALYSVIGTTYGGDGKTSFALPDLRGRFPIHIGQGPGLRDYALGQKGGAEQVTLLVSQMPAHMHLLEAAADGVGATGTPGPTVVFGVSSGPKLYAPTAGAPSATPADPIGFAGDSQPHDNMMPTLVANYCISLYGDYPPHG
jgi:microcystin-dependent protein